MSIEKKNSVCISDPTRSHVDPSVSKLRRKQIEEVFFGNANSSINLEVLKSFQIYIRDARFNDKSLAETIQEYKNQ